MDMFGHTIFVWVNCGPISLDVSSLRDRSKVSYVGSTEPVTSVVPTQDNQTYLVTSLDSHIRLMDMSTGRLLNDFTSHVNSAYRCRGCFGHAEATVVCGDENGMIWAWDLMDVSYSGSETDVLLH